MTPITNKLSIELLKLPIFIGIVEYRQSLLKTISSYNHITSSGFKTITFKGKPGTHNYVPQILTGDILKTLIGKNF